MQYRVEKITKNFKGYNKTLHVLKNINFSFNEGELIILFGPSGCGKSTLLNILSLIDEPTSGNLYLDDLCLNTLSKRKKTKFRQDNFGFIFQSFQLFNDLTSIENIILPGLFSKQSKTKLLSRAKSYLEEFNLLDRQHHFPNTLSGGEQQRVALARSLINDPSILLADEPTGNLDLENTTKVMQIFANMKEQKKSILMVSHNRELIKYADKVYYLNNGKLSLNE